MIPRKLHRIWLGDAEMPKQYQEFWEKWQRLHSGWECRTWDASAVENVALFNQLSSLSAKSDLLRYEILAREGGVYVDTDMEPLRAFDPLLEIATCFAAWEDDKRVCTALMGAEQGHPAVKELVRALPRWALARRRHNPDVQTGPVFLTETWKARHDVTLLPPYMFYPVGYWKRDRIGKVDYPPESFAVHHWGRSWMPDDKRQQDDKWGIENTIAILVPRLADNGMRDEVWRWLKPRWERHFPAADIVEGHSEPFNRAKAINDAARKIPGAEYFVIADADSWVDPKATRAALDNVKDFLIPWNRGYKLTQASTKNLLMEDTHAVTLSSSFVQRNLDEPEHHHLSGVIVVSREAFDAVGGFDERFNGWGFEDTAFVYQLEGRSPNRARSRGVANLIHLWHPPAADQGNPPQASVDLFNEYRRERGLKPWRRGIDR